MPRNSVRFRSVVVSLAFPRSSTMLCFLPHLGYPASTWGHKWCVCNNMQRDGHFAAQVTVGQANPNGPALQAAIAQNSTATFSLVNLT